MEFGKRLLPQVVDHYARTQPSRVYASIPKSSTDLSDGFQDVTMRVGNLNTIAYIGAADIRYAAMFLAAVKCNYKILFISPRNQAAQNQSMLVGSNCNNLFYAEELAPTVAILKENLPRIIIQRVQSLTEILQTSDNTQYYIFEKSFEEARDEPCLILHSSGSTGDPKLVTMTHGTFAVTDNDRNMPTPEGRRPQNAGQFNFEGGGRFYSCFPPYHLAGVHAYIDLPIFATSATVVFGPTMLPPSGFLLSEILKHQRVRAFYVPPFILEQWWAEPAATEQANYLDFVLYGGGPLSPQIGNALSKNTDVCQMYGSLEMGQIQLLVPQTGEWSYLELNPFEEADMQPADDGLFEMVLHQNPKFASRRSIWHNFPNAESWRTGDLFIPHPTKTGLWRFHSRIDDMVVLSSSYKIRPLEMETIIQGDPLLHGALIAGQGKSEPLLIVEPKPGVYDGNPSAFFDCIWPSVKEANAVAPAYAQLRRSRVIIASSDRPFIRAPKGSIVRKLTIKLYADEIETAYTDFPSQDESIEAHLQGVDFFILPGVKQYIRKHVEEYLPDMSISDNDNIFLRGLESLGAAGLSRRLGIGLASGKVSLQMLYRNPTIEELAAAIVNIILNRGVPEAMTRDVKSMQLTVEEFTENLPTMSKPSIREQKLDGEGTNVVLIGPRGSLAPYVVRELLGNLGIKKLYCLNRGDGGRERMRASFVAQGLQCDADDQRLSFMRIALGEPRLGLSADHYTELLENAHILIHNAWKVDFSWTLDSYKVEHLYSVRALVDFAAESLLRPRIVFISSISSVQDWGSIYPHKVTELPFEGAESYAVASPLGYGQSKHVSERILTQANVISGTPVTILRIGQVAGPTATSGAPWSRDEWIPSLAAISKALQQIPTDLPEIDWLPVDLMARSICELALQQVPERQLSIFNVVNPNLSEWATFVSVLRARLGENIQLVTLTEWVDRLGRTDPRDMSDEVASSSMKILPFFQHLAETAAGGIALQPKFETTNGVKASRTIAEAMAINKALIDIWCQQWGI